MSYLPLKRVLDILFSLIVLIVLSPLLLIVSLAIKLESPGPVLFKQERLGRHGQVFKVFKFRSMITGADKIGTGHYSFQGDPRVTRVGHIIRMTSIDELPQFANVLRGEMSVIGPRPPLTQHPYPLSEYSKADRKRFLLRPGITGWAQINGRKEISWQMRFKYDRDYVERCSFGFDCKIALLTLVKLVQMSDNVNVNKTV